MTGRHIVFGRIPLVNKVQICYGIKVISKFKVFIKQFEKYRSSDSVYTLLKRTKFLKYFKKST